MKTTKKLLSVVLAILTLAVFMAFSASAVTAPKAPATVSATSTASTITVNWSAVKGADGYRLYYKTPKSTSWKKCVSSTKKTTHTFTNPAKSKVYTIAVRTYSKNTDGTVVWGKYTTVQTATKPLATTEITPTPNLNHIKLNWEAVKGATHYKVYEKVEGKWTSRGYTTKLEKTIKNLSTETKYEFAVRSYIKLTDSLIAGSYKTIETATWAPHPTNLKLQSTDTTISLKWDKSPYVTGYRVYYKVYEGSSPSWKIAVKATSASSYTMKNLKPDTSYGIIVRPYIKTSSGNVFGCYDIVGIRTKTASDDKVVAVTDGGLKLYEITSKEAKEIYEKWGSKVFTYYETKNSENKTLIYTKNSSGWSGTAIDGSKYDSFGKIKTCPYCGKIEGRGTNMCNGCGNYFEPGGNSGNV